MWAEKIRGFWETQQRSPASTDERPTQQIWTNPSNGIAILGATLWYSTALYPKWNLELWLLWFSSWKTFVGGQPKKKEDEEVVQHLQNLDQFQAEIMKLN